MGPTRAWEGLAGAAHGAGPKSACEAGAVCPRPYFLAFALLSNSQPLSNMRGFHWGPFVLLDELEEVLGEQP